jgi:hypothetical protein
MPILNQALTPSLDDKFKRASAFIKERETINAPIDRVSLGHKPLILARPAQPINK